MHPYCTEGSESLIRPVQSTLDKIGVKLMALADITIANGAETPANQVFSYVTTQNGKVIRSNLTRTPDLPMTLTIGHTKAKVRGVQVDSHLWRVDNSVMDADGVTTRYANIRVMVDCDPAIYTDGLADDLAAFVRNYFTSANTRLWMKGSVG